MDCLVILLFSLLTPVFAYPWGAGLSACTTLVPGHLKEPQPANTLPFRIVPDADHFVINRVLKVRIGSVLDKKFNNRKLGGFFVQARAPGGTAAVGRWIVDGEEADNVASIKTLNCSHPADSITHTNPRPKSGDIILHFLPTGDMPERIQFLGTIARDFAHYWTNVRSPIISRLLPEPEIPPPTPLSRALPEEIHNVTHSMLHQSPNPPVPRYNISRLTSSVKGNDTDTAHQDDP